MTLRFKKKKRSHLIFKNEEQLAKEKLLQISQLGDLKDQDQSVVLKNRLSPEARCIPKQKEHRVLTVHHKQQNGKDDSLKQKLRSIGKQSQQYFKNLVIFNTIESNQVFVGKKKTPIKMSSYLILSNPSKHFASSEPHFKRADLISPQKKRIKQLSERKLKQLSQSMMKNARNYEQMLREKLLERILKSKFQLKQQVRW